MRLWISLQFKLLWFGIAVFSAAAPSLRADDQPPHADTTFLFYLSYDSHDMFGGVQFYNHIKKIFDKSLNPSATRYNAVILYDPYEFGEVPRLEVIKNGVLDVGNSFSFANKTGEKVMIDMGKKETFAGFLSAIKNANIVSDHYFLVFDGHGDGFEGFGADTNSDTLKNPSFLEITDMTSSLKSIMPLPNGRSKLDAVVFSSCLMGSLEVMYEFQPVSDYYMASSMPLPWAGSDIFAGGMSKKQLTKTAENYNYQNYNLKFDFLNSNKPFSVPELLELMMRSFVVIEKTIGNRTDIIAEQWDPLIRSKPESPFFQPIIFTLSLTA